MRALYCNQFVFFHDALLDVCVRVVVAPRAQVSAVTPLAVGSHVC